MQISCLCVQSCWVRHIVCFERFSDYRADVSCFATELRSFITIQTNRCGRICFFLTLLLSNLNANIVFVRAALLWCGTLYIVTALEVIEQISHVLLLKCV